MISTHFGVETATSTHIVSLLLTSSLCSYRYTLVAVISHMGKNTDHGHYICHVRKNGQWILFNDEKVRTVVAAFVWLVACELVVAG
jgi:ubiquitin C-terminal hydrolase